MPHFAGVEKICMIDPIRRKYGEQSYNPPHLSRILMDFSDSHSTDEKDRIFAFLNISSASADDTLKPDYSKPDREIFELVARHSLMTEQPFLHFSATGLANGIKPGKWPS